MSRGARRLYPHGDLQLLHRPHRLHNDLQPLHRPHHLHNDLQRLHAGLQHRPHRLHTGLQHRPHPLHSDALQRRLRSRRQRRPKKRVISQEILPEKTDEQIAAEEDKKVKDFFIDIQKQRQAKLKEKSYFYIPRDLLRQKVEAHKKKMLEVRKPPPLSDYDRSLVKSHDAHKKRKRASGKDVPQLGQKKQQCKILLLLMNMVPT